MTGVSLHECNYSLTVLAHIYGHTMYQHIYIKSLKYKFHCKLQHSTSTIGMKFKELQ